MNYVKICLYCGSTFLSNRSTAKYCCSRHNSLYWQMTKGKGRGATVIKGENQKDEELLSEQQKIDSCYRLVPDLVFISRWGKVYEASEDEKIIYLNEFNSNATQELIWIEDDLLENLKYGIGVHNLKDRVGSQLYYSGESNFFLKTRLQFINLQKRRKEEWVFTPGNIVICHYSPFEIFEGVLALLERKKEDGIEKEKMHLLWTETAQKFAPHLVYGVEVTERLKETGILYQNVTASEFEYIVLPPQTVKNFAANGG